MNKDFLEELKKIIITSQANYSKEWLSLKEGAKYAGVSYTHSLNFVKWDYVLQK